MLHTYETGRNSGWTILIRILGWNFSQPFLFWEADCQTDKIWRTRARPNDRATRESTQTHRHIDMNTDTDTNTCIQKRMVAARSSSHCRQSDALFILVLSRTSSSSYSPSMDICTFPLSTRYTLSTYHTTVLYTKSVSYTKAATMSRRSQDICLRMKISYVPYDLARIDTLWKLPRWVSIPIVVSHVLHFLEINISSDRTIRDDSSILRSQIQWVTNLYIQCQSYCKTSVCTWSLLFFSRGVKKLIVINWGNYYPQMGLFVENFDKM